MLNNISIEETLKRKEVKIEADLYFRSKKPVMNAWEDHEYNSLNRFNELNNTNVNENTKFGIIGIIIDDLLLINNFDDLTIICDEKINNKSYSIMISPDYMFLPGKIFKNKKEGDIVNIKIPAFIHIMDMDKDGYLIDGSEKIINIFIDFDFKFHTEIYQKYKSDISDFFIMEELYGKNKEGS